MNKDTPVPEGSNAGRLTPEREAAAGSVVFLVHGTFAGAALPVRPTDENAVWWDPEGNWQGKLRKALLDLKYGGKVEFRSFQWTDPKKGPGENLESARGLSGERLLDVLLAFEKNDTRPYHLVGHSHGGSVIWHALVASIRREREEKGQRLRRLQSWMSAGTPFIEFRGNPVDWWGPLLALLAGALVFLAGWLWLPVVLPGSPADFAQLWWHAPDRVSPSDISGARNLAYGTFFLLCWLGWGSIISWLLDRWGIQVTRRAILRWVMAAGVAAFSVFKLRSLTTSPDQAWSLTPQRALLVLTVVVLVFYFFALGKFGQRCWAMWKISWQSRNRRFYEAQAAKEYGERWLGISHPDDEAIALMGAAMLDTPDLRPPQRQGDDRSRRLTVVDSLDRLVRPLFNEATWRTLVQFALGDDRAGLYAVRVGRAPEVLESHVRLLSRADSDIISEGANSKAEVMIAGLRGNLRYLLNEQGEAEFRSMLNRISFDGVIHCSYLSATSQPDAAGEPVLRMFALWIALRERSGLGAEQSLIPPPVVASGRNCVAVTAAIGRFARLEFATVMLWCVAGVASALAVLWMLRTQVEPATQARQYQEVAGAAERDPQILNLQDSALAGAHAVYLAAADRIRSAEDVARVMTEVTTANARAIIGQRLAFLFGLTGKEDLAAAVIKYTSPRSSTFNAAEYRMRAEGSSALSLLYGRMLGGGTVTDREVGDILDEFNRAPAKRKVLNCSDTDHPGVLAMLVPVMLAGGKSLSTVGKVMEDAAVDLETRCLPEHHKALFDREGWVALRTIAMARNLMSWSERFKGARGLARKVLLLNAEKPAPPDKTAPTPERMNTDIPVEALRNALVRREQQRAKACILAVEQIGGLLKAKATAAGDGAGQTDKLCAEKKALLFERTHHTCTSFVVRGDKDVANTKEMQACQPAADTIFALNTASDLSIAGLPAFCRADPVVASGQYRSAVAVARHDCNLVGESSGAAVSLALVLAALDEPPEHIRTLFEPALPETLIDKTKGKAARAAAPAISTSLDDADSLPLFHLEGALAHIRAAIPSPESRISAPGYLMDALDHRLEQMDLSLKRARSNPKKEAPKARHQDIDDRMADLKALRLRVLAHKDSEAAERQLLHWLAERRAQPDAPLSLRQASALAQAITDVAVDGGSTGKGGVIELSPALAARLVEAAISPKIDRQQPVLPKILRPREDDNDLETVRALIEQRIRIEALFSRPQGRLAPVLDVIDEQQRVNQSEEVKLTLAPLRARALVANGNYAAALDAARETARRDQLASIHCAILERAVLAQADKRKAFALEPGLIWPKPVPVLFDKGPYYTFDGLARGLPRCELYSPPEREEGTR